VAGGRRNTWDSFARYGVCPGSFNFVTGKLGGQFGDEEIVASAANVILEKRIVFELLFMILENEKLDFQLGALSDFVTLNNGQLKVR